MTSFAQTPRVGQGSPRSSKKLRLTTRVRKSRKAFGLSLIEALEDRRLMTIYNPVAVPLLTAVETTTGTNFVVATFASSDPIGTLSAQVFFAPGTTTASPTTGTINAAGSVFVPGIGVTPEYTVTTTATFGQSTGSSQPQFSVAITDTTDVPTTTAVAIGTMQITDAPLAAGAVFAGATIAENTSFPSTTPLLNFTDGNASATIGDFMSTIDWGDGSPIVSGTIVQLAAGSFTVEGGHTYTEEAAATNIKISVQDIGGSTIQASSGAIVVTDAPLGTPNAVPANGVEGQQLSGVPVATFVDANTFAKASDFTATINWGDLSPLDTGVVTLAGGAAGGATFVVTGSHKYATVNAAFPISVVVTDKGGAAPLTITSAANITQTPIVVNALPLAVNAAMPSAAGKVVGTFTDAGGGDCVSWSANAKFRSTNS